MNKDKTIPKLWDNKVDKGGYTGTAQNLKSEIDSKVSKNGDTMTGTLSVDTKESNNIVLKYGGDYTAAITVSQEYLSFWNEKSKRDLTMYNNGNTIIKANNLTTSSKEVIGAINELNSNKFDKTGGTINGKTVVVGDLIAKNKLSSYPGHLILDNDSGDVKGGYYVEPDSSVTVKNYTSNKVMSLCSNGSAVFEASNLQTNAKEVVSAINELKASIYTTFVIPSTSTTNPAEYIGNTTWTRIGEQNVGGTTVYYWKRNS